ncbi:MAG: polymerase subunit beta [Nevskia sp.]|nr:polymerase subunit beta [Nevskia sp.]
MMNIQTSRGELLGAIQSVIGVVERRQSLPILSNVLMVASDDELSITASDLELQAERRIRIQNVAPGRMTLPARKLHDICRGLPEGASVTIEQDQARAVIRSGKSRYVLSCLPAEEFPLMASAGAEVSVKLRGGDLKDLINRTQFAIAQQDVRYYLNGLMLELKTGKLRAVATDGHRLALAEKDSDITVAKDIQAIVPRKAVMELQRQLEQSTQEIDIRISAGQIEVDTGELKLLSKLIDGRFPDYQRVVPDNSDKQLSSHRERLRSALARAAVLSNEKFRGVRLQLDATTLRIETQNPDQEEAQEEIEVTYQGDPLEIGFNVNYLLDALDAIDSEDVVIELRSADASGLIYDPKHKENKYVVMPMRL